MIISVIAAVANNGVIGNQGTLPWHLPDDLKNFRRLTLNKPVVMGRRTWESLPNPLPQRRCIVISSQPINGPDAWVRDPEQALRECAEDEEVMIIGGERVFRFFLPRCTHLHLTTIEADVPGDTYLPELDLDAFELVEEIAHPADARHQYPFVYREFRRALA